LIVTATGWTIRELDATPWPDVLDLLDYWTASPPVHVMVRAYMGIKGEEPEDHEIMSEDDFMAMVRQMGPAASVIRGPMP
jgi:hypothetical protein